MSARRWTAEVYRADRSQVGLRRPGDGRSQSDPFADPGCLYIIGPDEARALGEALIAAADAVAPRARRFFVFDGESYDATHTSPDDARKAAEKALDGWRQDADTEWADEVRSVAWGEVIERAEAVPDEHAEDDEERGVDYRLTNCRGPVVAPKES